MPFDPPQDDKPKRPRKNAGILRWPGSAYFVIAVLVGAIVARLMQLWVDVRF